MVRPKMIIADTDVNYIAFLQLKFIEEAWVFTIGVKGSATAIDAKTLVGGEGQ
jgi:hypothetical protein